MLVLLLFAPFGHFLRQFSARMQMLLILLNNLIQTAVSQEILTGEKPRSVAAFDFDTGIPYYTEETTTRFALFSNECFGIAIKTIFIWLCY